MFDVFITFLKKLLILINLAILQFTRNSFAWKQKGFYNTNKNIFLLQWTQEDATQNLKTKLENKNKSNVLQNPLNLV